MKKQGIASITLCGASMGLATMLDWEFQEKIDHIIPSSVRLSLLGEKLVPTSFDVHGNPRIDGIANLILNWKIRQMIRDCKLESEYNIQVDYSYITTDNVNFKIPLKRRSPQLNVCPVCGKKFKLSDFDDNVVELKGYYHITHEGCSADFLQLKMIDTITEAVHFAFDSYLIDDENRFAWGMGNKGMSYKLIPNEYCSPECCLCKPWFMFFTPIGDIKVGWRKRVFSVQWMENFPAFDMSIFNSEDVIKNINGKKVNNAFKPGDLVAGRREIHADSIEMVQEYLSLAREIVLPNKSKE